MMTRALTLSLCLLALPAPLAAEEPEAKESVLILDNERTLLGEITLVGDSYRVRRGSGAIYIKKERALRLCDSLEEAYRYLRSHSNGEDPMEHLRLARWCHVQGLTSQAEAELKEVLRLKPEHAEAHRLQRMIRWAAEHEAKKKLRAEAKPPVKLMAKEEDEEPPAVALDKESMALFTRRIQPILMNACARCHAGEQSEKFVLEKARLGAFLDARTTQRNLLAVLGQIDGAEPARSPLLTEAIRAHGKASLPPLHGRTLAAHSALRKWVDDVVTKHPHLKNRLIVRDAPINPLPTREKGPKWEELRGVGREEKSGTPFGATNPAAPTVIPNPTTVRSTKPKPKLVPKDEMDPLIFNQMMHPERFGEPEEPEDVPIPDPKPKLDRKP